mgnify:CR=1 FL=1
MKFSSLFIATALYCSANILSTAAGFTNIEFRNEPADTTAFTNILIEVETIGITDNGKLVTEIARKFINCPYESGTLEGNEERLRISSECFDCTTLAETTLALAMTINERRTSWRDFAYNLEKIRYRGGKLNGYASRLHYISDWIVDNTYRGNIEEVTAKIGRPDYYIKTLDFMTHHREKYPALKDSANYAAMKEAEIGYRSHRFPYIKSMNIKNAELKEGDIVAITCGMKDLDVTHIGIITFVDNAPHLLHASSKAGKVIIDPLPLTEYLRKNKSATGIRVIRIKD